MEKSTLRSWPWPTCHMHKGHGLDLPVTCTKVTALTYLSHPEIKAHKCHRSQYIHAPAKLITWPQPRSQKNNYTANGSTTFIQGHDLASSQFDSQHVLLQLVALQLSHVRGRGRAAWRSSRQDVRQRSVTDCVRRHHTAELVHCHSVQQGSWKKREKKAHQTATSGQQAWPLSGFRILLSKTTQYPQSFIHSNGHSDTELRTQNFSFTVVFVLLHFRLTLKNFQIWCFPTPFCSMYDLIETKVLSYSSGNQRAWNVCLMCNTALTLAKHSLQNQKTKLDRIRKPHQYRIREPSQYRIRKLSQYRIREPSQTELGNPANI